MIILCKWTLLMLLSISLFGCLGKNLDDKIQKGPLSQKELQTERGVAQSVQQIPTGQEIHQYSDNESFQINGEGQVTHHFRNPTDQEASLQYWLNRWQNNTYYPTPVGGSDYIDTLKSLYYINYDNNERFIYDASIQKVTRVIYELDIDEG